MRLLNLPALPSFGAVIVFLALRQNAGSQPIQFNKAEQTVVEERLCAYTRRNSDREPTLQKLLEDAGCKGDALVELTVKGSKASNVLCTHSGTTDSIIVVGAHFDFVEAGNGVVDNWSGAALLPSLYQGLEGARKHTYVFAGFTGEESGLIGSKSFVKELGERRLRVRAMINMDSLGLSETKIWVSYSDQELVRWIGAVAKSVDLPVAGLNVDQVGSTDSESFRERKIPSITIHSVTQDALRILHSPADRIEAIHLDESYRTYQLVLAYLAVLDQKLE